MQKQIKSEAAKNKRDQMIEVATHKMGLKGYKGVSVQDVSDGVGIHKSTFFHYFNNKEELLLEVVKKGIDEVTDDLKRILKDDEAEPEEKLEKAINSLVTVLINHIDNVKVFHSEIRYLPEKEKKEFLKKRDAYEILFRQVVANVKKSGRGYFQDMDTKIVTLGILGMCNWMLGWYNEKGPYSPKEISKIFFRMIAHRADSL
jgi:AcrR family transcriptional regulator